MGRYTARAETFLGDCALNGQGLRRDPVEAVRWYRRAADRGLAAAQNGMGVALGQGKGVPRDDAAAVAWFRRAASQGHPEAEFNLAMCYARGLGVAMSPTEALALTSHAAVRGHPDAQYTLGLWFEEGKATLPCDQAGARQWYQRARTQGHKDAIAKTMHKHKVLDPKTFKPTTPTNSAWADGLSTNERYEWMGNCYAMRCDDDYVWGGGILRGPWVTPFSPPPILSSVPAVHFPCNSFERSKTYILSLVHAADQQCTYALSTSSETIRRGHCSLSRLTSSRSPFSRLATVLRPRDGTGHLSSTLRRASSGLSSRRATRRSDGDRKTSSVELCRRVLEAAACGTLVPE